MLPGRKAQTTNQPKDENYKKKIIFEVFELCMLYIGNMGNSRVGTDSLNTPRVSADQRLSLYSGSLVDLQQAQAWGGDI